MKYTEAKLKKAAASRYMNQDQTDLVEIQKGRSKRADLPFLPTLYFAYY